jgi:hypothetical protein
MLANILAIVASVLTGFAVPAFGYLKYRAYTSTVRDVVDKLGVDGLEKLGVIAPPSNLTQYVPRRRATGVRRG